MREFSAACLVLLLFCSLAFGQTMTLRELSSHEGYTEAHWFPDGEHLLLVRRAAEPHDYDFTITDRLGNVDTTTRNRKQLQFHAADRVYLIGGGSLYSVGTDGLYATRALPDTYRGYTHVSPDGR